MATTLPIRAGSALRVVFRYLLPGKTGLVDTTSYTARLQLRSTQRPGRVLLNTVEYSGALPAPAGTVLTRLNPGEWEMYLSGAITRSLPPVTRFEVELVSITDPDDVTPLADGVITTAPQAVSNV